MTDKLSEHLKGLASEADNLLKSIPLGNIDPEVAEKISIAQSALDFSNGDSIEVKQQKLNNALNAITNYKRSI